MRAVSEQNQQMHERSTPTIQEIQPLADDKANQCQKEVEISETPIVRKHWLRISSERVAHATVRCY